MTDTIENINEPVRSKKIDRLGVNVELHGDGHGFFHIIYAATDCLGFAKTEPLRPPTRCQFQAAKWFEEECRLLQTKH